MLIKNKLYYSFILAPLVSLSMVANAEDNNVVNKSEYNFATLRFGVDQPITSGGNANIDNAEATYQAGVEVGRKFMDIFAVGFEYKKIGNSDLTVNNSNRPQDTTYSSKWKGKSDMFMLNFSADVIKNSAITPYVKFGLGASVNKSSDYIITRSATTGGRIVAQEIYYGKSITQFAWQAGLGINVTSTELFDIDMSYMFVSRGQMTTSDGYAGRGFTADESSHTAAARNINLYDHTVSVGFKAKF